jgi:hypothetical protein
VKIPYKETNYNNNNIYNNVNSNNGDKNCDKSTVINTEMLFESYWESEYPRLGESRNICTQYDINTYNDNDDNNGNDDYDGNDSNNKSNDSTKNSNNDNNDKDNNNKNNNKTTDNSIDVLYGFNTWMNNSKPSEGWKISPKKDKYTSILLSNIIQSYNEKDCDDDVTNSDESNTIISRYFDKNCYLSDEEDDNNEINDRKMLIENLKKKYDNNKNKNENNDDDNQNENENENDNENESNSVGEVIKKNETVRLNEDSEKVEEDVRILKVEGDCEIGVKEGEEEAVKIVNVMDDNLQAQDHREDERKEGEKEWKNEGGKVQTEIEEKERENEGEKEGEEEKDRRINGELVVSHTKDEGVCDGDDEERVTVMENETGGGNAEIEVNVEEEVREESKGRDEVGEEKGEVDEKGRDRGSVLKGNQMQIFDVEIEKERNNIETKLADEAGKTDDVEDDIMISESASNDSHSENENENESENSSHQSQEHKKLKNTVTKKNKNNSRSTEIVEEKTVILDDENSNLVYSRIHGYRILVPDKNDSKAFYKKILGGLKEVRIVMTYFRISIRIFL